MSTGSCSDTGACILTVHFVSHYTGINRKTNPTRSGNGGMKCVEISMRFLTIKRRVSARVQHVSGTDLVAIGKG